MRIERVVFMMSEKCKGCLNAQSNRCRVITNPKYIWAKGDCWARKETPEEMRAMLEDIYRYLLDHDATPWVIRDVYDEWRAWNKLCITDTK